MVEHIRLNNVNRPNAELNKKIQYAKSGSTVLTTALLVIMLGYFFFPVLWLAIDTTKSTEQLFTTPMLAFPNHWNLISNLKTLSTYKGGEFWRWIFNSVIYAVVTAVVGALLSAMVGYVLAKYHFKGHGTVFWLVLSALMVPSAVLVVPIFILERDLGLLNSYIGVILPMLVNPFGVYFMSVYIGSTVPSELLDAARVDGASEFWIFVRVVLRLIFPGLVTLLLIAFIAAWNNFFLPLVLLNKSTLFPSTVGLSVWVSTITTPGAAPLYPLVMLGSFISIFPMLILFPFLRNYISNGVLSGSLKD